MVGAIVRKNVDLVAHSTNIIGKRNALSQSSFEDDEIPIGCSLWLSSFSFIARVTGKAYFFPLFSMLGKSLTGMILGIVTIIGALNWGLVGIGFFLKMQLNIVSLIAPNQMSEAVIYVIVGLCGLGVLVLSFRK